MGGATFTDPMNATIHRTAAGGVAGFVATVPMTLVMAAVERVLLPTVQPLAPKQIVRNTARQANVGRLRRRKRNLIGWIAHFAFGTVTGALFPLVLSRAPGPAAIKGGIYGLAVWAASYLGWLPAAGILPPATEQSKRRNISLVAAHLVWGATVGILVNFFARSRSH
jgi:uncharacterized membrane protein YagU involved in acid resistance